MPPPTRSSVSATSGSVPRRLDFGARIPLEDGAAGGLEDARELQRVEHVARVGHARGRRGAERRARLVAARDRDLGRGRERIRGARFDGVGRERRGWRDRRRRDGRRSLGPGPRRGRRRRRNRRELGARRERLDRRRVHRVPAISRGDNRGRPVRPGACRNARDADLGLGVLELAVGLRGRRLDGRGARHFGRDRARARLRLHRFEDSRAFEPGRRLIVAGAELDRALEHFLGAIGVPAPEQHFAEHLVNERVARCDLSRRDEHALRLRELVGAHVHARHGDEHRHVRSVFRLREVGDLLNEGRLDRGERAAQLDRRVHVRRLAPPLSEIVNRVRHAWYSAGPGTPARATAKIAGRPRVREPFTAPARRASYEG